MEIVPMGKLREALTTLQGTVGYETSVHHTTHKIIMGATATLELYNLEHTRNDAMQLCRLMRQRYVENLEAIIKANLEELRQIAVTGKSDNLIAATRMLDQSFRAVEPKFEEGGESWLL